MASIDSRPEEKNHIPTLSEIKVLGQNLLLSKAFINNLALLLPYLSPAMPHDYTLEALFTLQSFFKTELPTSSKDVNEKYRTWLDFSFVQFRNSLLEIAISADCNETLREIALDSLMEFVKTGSKGRTYSDYTYAELLRNFLDKPLPVDFFLELLAYKYFKYVDIQYFTYVSISKFAGRLKREQNSGGRHMDVNDDDDKKPSMELSINRLHFLLSHIPPPPPIARKDMPPSLSMETEYETWGIPEFTAKYGGEKKLREKFEKAWMSFLRLSLPLDVFKEVLVNLDQAVIPYMCKPEMLGDFLTRSFDIGGAVSVMALGGVHALMSDHRFHIQNFYEKLYALLKPSIFRLKNRARFFELLDLCLDSRYLPTKLVAAFTKRLSRLSLVAPPSGAVVIICLIHNLLRRNSGISHLIQGAAKSGDGIDSYNEEATDFENTNAEESSLWELDSLRHHYCPAVYRAVKLLDGDLIVREETQDIAIKDFSAASYSAIFAQEMKRKEKRVVPLAIHEETPNSLFCEADFPGWTFKHVDEGEEKKSSPCD